ncbi:Beta-mannosidase precursor, putative [Perkinsus marinus ATCC 50983]|uniref:beta-mannosidase n=1 Tax=Perkinsus marinus (strain ATCC 50983 / TXsc) TaxID=423536 RepID=C5KH10_PERM5|nr:Beta-mannosidase precursor, putative [Perkinsus marinus ATCC 50983]EER15872.1 Beta-mannosidase precursor, putative [Perkinsus marinus ATCC 50983]|eukprot:XP_002784076.1 Beta-mannosidase precursor, putative [Perkinsus marinus ATCC 50983]
MRAYVVALPFVSPLVAGDFVWSLSGSSGGRWRLTQHGNASFQEVEAIVPGQVHLDLWRSHVIPDPYYGYNDTALRYVAEADWLYSTKFAVPREACDEAKVSLPATIFFYGIDTVADVTLNGCPILSADNMFRTYNATMKRGQLLCDRDNEMSVLLKSPVKTAKERAETYERKHSDWSIGVPPRELPAVWNGFDRVQMLRKEPCSFGWDWGPGLATSGIWKDVQVVTHQLERGRSLTVEGVTWDVKPISVTRLDAWQANVHISLALSPDIQVDRVSSWANLRIEDLRPGSRSGVNFTILDGVKPWWPNGYGDQHRYTLSVCAWAGDKGDACEGDKITVGFKTVDLVMEEDDYGRSFYFKLNGESIYARGANWIPADAFESRVDESRLRKHFEQYRKAHFNMLRVWGGGVYASDLFYELADEYGFLIWEEAMFAGATYPTLLPGFLASVELEISQNLIRIGHHPSLAILGGNNEVEAFYGWVGITDDKVYLESYAALFFDTILATSKKLLPWLPAIPSSPWNGDETRQNPVDDNPGNETSGDIHFYNYFSPNMFDLRKLPKPRFMSEFGFQSWSSLGELRTVADEEMLEESLFSEDPSKNVRIVRCFRIFGLWSHPPLMAYYI